MRTTLFLTLLALACATAPVRPVDPLDAPIAGARAVVEELTRGDYAATTARFAPGLKEKLPATALEETWTKRLGRPHTLRHATATATTRDGLVKVVEACEFDELRLDVSVVFEPDGRVTGLFFKPYPPAADVALTHARAFVEELASGRHEEARARLTPAMTAALAGPGLGALWNDLGKGRGAFRGPREARASTDAEYTTAFVTADWERGTATFKLVLDAWSHVAGLFVIPGDAGTPWSPAPYVDATLFEDRVVQVGTAPALPGHLSIPKGAGPFPVVILVHGSGPGDEDESVGNARPFRDLAHGLASRGVAVLRHDKRTRVDPKGVQTVQEEYFQALDDALALVARTPELDAKRIVVVGHSLGAFLAPWIARDHPAIAGAALLAAPARPLYELLVEQLEYFERLSPGDGRRLAEARTVLARSRAADLKADERLFGSTGAYELFLRGYDPVATAAALAVPLFVAQGGRDYQVSPDRDFAAYRDALAGRPNARLELYPALNHLLVPGEGPSTPDEYERAGHVDPKLVDDLAAWVLSIGR